MASCVPRRLDSQIDSMSGCLGHDQAVFEALRVMCQMPTVQEDHRDAVLHCQADLAERSPAAADGDHGLRRQNKYLIASLPEASEDRKLDTGIWR